MHEDTWDVDKRRDLRSAGRAEELRGQLAALVLGAERRAGQREAPRPSIFAS
jgi:hypothetical protein